MDRRLVLLIVGQLTNVSAQSHVNTVHEFSKNEFKGHLAPVVAEIISLNIAEALLSTFSLLQVECITCGTYRLYPGIKTFSTSTSLTPSYFAYGY